MSWLLIALFVAVEEKPSPPPAKPAASAEAKAPTKETPKGPVRLRRSDRERSKSAKPSPDEPKADAPTEAPAPKQPPSLPAEMSRTQRPTDLDQQLLKQLGKDLEVAEMEEEEPPLMRIGQRMRSVEERLARLDGSDETTSLQKKIIDDLDALLKQLQQSNDNQSQSQSQKQCEPKQGQNSQAKSKPGKTGQATPKATQAATQASRGAAERERFSKVLEDKNVWGHLSEVLRQEMSQYAKEQFLEKYRDLLEQYYSTIAEKSRSGSE